MSRGLPVTLLGTVLALYRQDANGGLLSDAPVWLGCCHEEIRVEESADSRNVTPTGDAYPRNLQSPSRIVIELESTWVIRADTAGLRPFHGQTYALSIAWHSPETDLWEQHIFWDVTVESRSLRSLGVHQVMRSLRFTAGSATEVAGSSGVGTESIGPEQSLVSVRDEVWKVGDRLHGVYRWSGPARIKSARLVCSGAAAVRLFVDGQPGAITLENAGVWTGDILIAANSTVHWEVVDLEDGEVMGAVTFNIVTETPSSVELASLTQQLLAWTEAEAFSQTNRLHDANGILESASVIWPDGKLGDLTVLAANLPFLAVDSFEVTYVRGVGLPTYRITQGAVGRNENGDVTWKPRPTVEVV